MIGFNILGYATRQALYACLTCCPSSSLACICLACSYHCHEGHDLVELYTKRKFRCDCGNGKMGQDQKCKLVKEQKDRNADNK